MTWPTLACVRACVRRWRRFIIGKGGETIRDLQDRTGANIQVQKEFEAKPGATTRTVTLSGRAERVDEAKELLQRIIQDRQSGCVLCCVVM